VFENMEKYFRKMRCTPRDNSFPCDLKFGEKILSSSILPWMRGPNAFLDSRVGSSSFFEFSQ
jgi:hypothetical protein